MDKKNFITAIVENSPLALTIVGLCVFIVAACGGLARYGLTVTDLAWRIALGIVGAVTTLCGILLFLTRGSRQLRSQRLDPERFKIKITYPKPRDIVPRRFDVQGTYEAEPSDSIGVRILELSPKTGKYRPGRRIIFEKDQKIWQATNCDLGGDPGDERIILVALLGENGQALCDLYDRVGPEAKRVGVVKLTNDMVECDRRILRLSPQSASASSVVRS